MNPRRYPCPSIPNLHVFTDGAREGHDLARAVHSPGMRHADDRQFLRRPRDARRPDVPARPTLSAEQWWIIRTSRNCSAALDDRLPDLAEPDLVVRLLAQ